MEEGRKKRSPGPESAGGARSSSDPRKESRTPASARDEAPTIQPRGAPTIQPRGARKPAAEEAALSPAGETATATLEPEDRPLLEVEGLVKVYGSRAVVDGVSFSVRSGEIIGLLGKNGAGKTTTFRMTIGMIHADEGVIRFSGRDITKLPMYKRARLGMGYLSQESSVFRGLTVEENLNAILETTAWSSSERVRKRDELVEEFGLGRLLHSKAAVLSGGEKRRLEIARALITEPTLILLDEPFSGVDPIAVSDIQQIIFRLRERGIGILLTDHNVRETLSTTDRSFIILDGKIIAQGNRDEILSNQYARKYYLGESFSM
jgi:lipopolysaccharide export system ATP-binding protein